MALKTFFCIDAHTCGNPVRLVAGGGPILEGKTISEKRLHFLKEFDWIRKGLMFEPRGSDIMSGSILYPPADPQNDIAILFIETSGCLPMCGHGTIGTVTSGIEQGLIRPKIDGKLRLETPAGLVLVDYKQKGNKVTSVKFVNVPAYLAATDIEVVCPELGKLKIDVSYGGNYYAIVDVQENFPGLEKFETSQLINWGRAIRKTIREKYDFVHPLDSNIHGLSHVLWTGATIDPTSTARNAVLYGDKAIDRSPCGTGTSARMAQWFAKGKLKIGDPFIHESIIGTKFIGRVEGVTKIGEFDGIIPSIEGWAQLLGFNNIIIDEEDQFPEGFQLI
ncbi:MAG: hydroxyproline-2-epimerase [Bacteroidetes bacterium HGW-Bacteroidetes-17]|jgi:4-hydroxyproline epimerase|nr:MAG: hydroxyproline-2-epimerase [Bacteroidetes bacterium HGW-Bacteroidetes-17]